MAHSEYISWHDGLWQRLSHSVSQNRLAHAYLLQGAAGVGKSIFASQIAQQLLCETDSDRACGQCKSCRLFEAGSHPDFRRIESEGGKAIGIDLIRDVSDYFALTSQYGANKIAVIVGAERMTTAAANALLKTLEEPPAGSLLILISSQASLLPITVRSRCQSLRITIPTTEEAQQWLLARGYAEADITLALEQARGAPLLAETLLRDDNSAQQRDRVLEGARQLLTRRVDPVELGESYLKLGAKQALYILWQWHAELIRCLALNRDSSDLALARQIGQPQLQTQMDSLSLGIKRLDAQLNEQLLLEDILISWIK